MYEEKSCSAKIEKHYALNCFFANRQEAFMENYFASQRDNIFRNVEVCFQKVLFGQNTYPVFLFLEMIDYECNRG